MEKLNDAQVEAQLTALSEWSESGGAIQRTYAFRNFADSMKFVNQVAEAAEAADHHPDILIRYNKVTLTLSTHDASGITQKDFDLAAKCDQIAGAIMPPVPAPAAAGGASRGSSGGGGGRKSRKAG